VLFIRCAVVSLYHWSVSINFNFNAMRTAKNTKPTLLEIINYWHDQKKKNLGRFDMQHYMRVCQAKAYVVRFDENNNMIRV
jgi:hypothetical protein